MKTNISAISPMSNGKWTVSEKEESWLEPGPHPQGSLETAFLDVVLCCPWMASSLALRIDYTFLKKKKRRRRWKKVKPFQKPNEKTESSLTPRCVTTTRWLSYHGEKCHQCQGETPDERLRSVLLGLAGKNAAGDHQVTEYWLVDYHHW